MTDEEFIKRAKEFNADTLNAVRTIRTSHPEMSRQQVLHHWLKLLNDEGRVLPPSYSHYLAQFIDQHWNESAPSP